MGTRCVLFTVAAIIILAASPGCKTHKDEAVQSALVVLRGSLKIQREPERAGDANTPYAIERFREAVAFLEESPTLDRPHMVTAYLYLLDNKPEDSGMEFQWLEYDTHAVGILLVEKLDDRRNEWRLPVFEWEKDWWPQTAGTRWRDTVSRIRRIWLVPTNNGEPSVRAVRRDDGRPPVELLMPRRIKQSSLEVSVYDERGSISNAVQVFICPAEPKVTD